MKVSHNSDLKILRVFGAFILLLYLGKMLGSPQVIGNVFFHLICLLMMYVCFTWTWELKLSNGKIESVAGPQAMKRTTIIGALQSVELDVGEVQADSKGDSFLLKLAVKSKHRLKPVVIFSGLKLEQSERLGEDAKNVSQALGGLPINVSEHFERLYKHLHHKEFKL